MNFRWRMSGVKRRCLRLGHTNVESKSVPGYVAIRCADRLAEEAIPRPDWDYGNIPRLWRMGAEARATRQEAERRQKALEEAFHQDPAQAALADWRGKHIK
jgi:hypothetical protein